MSAAALVFCGDQPPTGCAARTSVPDLVTFATGAARVASPTAGPGPQLLSALLSTLPLSGHGGGVAFLTHASTASAASTSGRGRLATAGDTLARWQPTRTP